MNITLTEFLNTVRKWESETAKVSAYIEIPHGPRMALRLDECKIVLQGDDHIVMYTTASQCELALLPNMTFIYSETEGAERPRPILEVRALAWRLILTESN